ncbi:competence type IV pilus ATPase ComGA [Aquisalibacillus elongatus]|uniref:Competence-related pilin export protein ComGA n=1 Tax=Aquisalibacillus elongatus TaxID=485577 RepID=A0A3N5CEJ3_9BACI|nr:competence type IV pilus ATPase ComGA [Aquisalibacillus elongatus]RPF55641.1 competence-related pilin export protein ComGA [Aquisalibacillus elongatus]
MDPEIQSSKLLTEAIKNSATDIHFTPNDYGISIHFRINGYRWYYGEISYKSYHTLLSYYKFSSGMDIAEHRIPQNGTIQFQGKDYLYDLRLSTLPTRDIESLAIRLLPTNYFPDIEHLFVFPSQASQLVSWINKRAGMILFTGPTGSGKTTTMYALLKKSIELYGFQAITLEDPVEQPIQNLLQVQVNEKAGFDYDVGLKAALRHDPDVIMVGEIRDEKTAKFAFKTALTGHLVLSTVHAKDAYGTIARLKEMGMKQSDLSESIIGIASQQLVKMDRTNKSEQTRAALAELLTGQNLKQALMGKPPTPDYQSFQDLRRKAHAHGYISQSS